MAGERVTALALLSLALEIELPIAHPTDFPHEEVESSEADSTSPLLIIAGIVVTLLLVGGLVWLKERARREEASGGADEGADAEPPGSDAGQRLST